MSRHAPGSVGFMQDAAARVFADAGIDTPRLDARLIMAHGLQRDTGWLIGYPEAELTTAQSSHLEALISRRAAREPLAYILGRKEFWSLEFKVSSATLIPRPDSETLVEAVLQRFADRDAAPRVLDLGTGSGCLLLSILHELPRAVGIGVDRSAGALRVAEDNAERLGLAPRCRFFEGNWFSALDNSGVDPFDIVLT
ncbi:MAG: peptide chain release factor N(5)-glutamine methyltransferase, partial [Rhodospirillaceae bacterium]|nr:peptide chain release factor N(5)-glutamine methyltransferase [Rhodospirillaceae bacterium]